MAISDDDDDQSLCFDCERCVSVSVSVPVPLSEGVYIESVRRGKVNAKNYNLMNKHN
jgi:hypothetical protein